MRRLTVERFVLAVATMSCGRVHFDPVGGGDGRVADAAVGEDGLAAPVAIQCASPIVRDDFDDGTIDQVLWSSGSSSVESAGSLTITPPMSNLFYGLGSVALYDYRDRWIAVEVVRAPPAGTGGAIGFRLDVPSEIDYPYAFIEDSMLIVGVYTPTTTAPLLRTPFEPINHRFVRMRAIGGGMLVWEVSSDAQTWNMIAQGPSVSFIDGSELQLLAYDQMDPVDTVATLDQLVVCGN